MTVDEVRYEIDRRMELLGGTPPNELAAIQRALEQHPNASLDEICTLVISQYGMPEGSWCGWPYEAKKF